MRALALSMALALAAPAVAMPPSVSMVEAGAHHRRGILHFELGQFKEALAEFETAYKVSPQPLLLFNIAQAQRLSGLREQALATYQAFLQAVPDAPNRSDVEGLIVELSRPVEVAPAPPPVVVVNSDERIVRTAPPRQPVYKKWWLWTTVGTVVVAGVVVGAVLGSRSSDTPSLGVIDARH